MHIYMYVCDWRERLLQNLRGCRVRSCFSEIIYRFVGYRISKQSHPSGKASFVTILRRVVVFIRFSRTYASWSHPRS